MRVRALRSHFVDGHVMPVGAVYELRESTALELIGAGRVERAPDPIPAPDPEPAPEAPRIKPKSKTSEAKP